MTNSIPESNRKVFAISVLVALIAVISFTVYATSKTVNTGVSREVMKKEVDPAKVFDAPIMKANLYYIDTGKYEGKTDDKNSIGCGDGLVSYEIPVGELNGPTKTDATTFVLGQLFDNKVFTSLVASSSDKDAKPYNVLASSTLAIKSVKEVPGQYEVRLTGNPKINGVCDVPRIQAQLEKTIGQIFLPSTVAIYLNDMPLGEALSEK